MNAEAVSTEITVYPPIPDWVNNAEEAIYKDLSGRKGLGNTIENCDSYPENLKLKVCQLILDNGDMETLGRKIVYQYCFDVPGFDKEWEGVDTEGRQELVNRIVTIIQEHMPVTVEPVDEVVNKPTVDYTKLDTSHAAAECYTNGLAEISDPKTAVKEAFLNGASWHAVNILKGNVIDFSQKQLEEMAVKHPYYFDIEPLLDKSYSSAMAFLADAESWIIDLNLCIRWDIRKQDDAELPNYGNYIGEFVFAKQRKGEVFAVKVERVYDYEIPRLRTFLTEHWRRLSANWEPISNTTVEIQSYTNPCMRSAVEAIIEVLSLQTPNDYTAAREFLIRELEKNNPPLTTTVAIMGWAKGLKTSGQVPAGLHDVCMDALRTYQQSVLATEASKSDYTQHDERELFIERVTDSINTVVEEVSLAFAGSGVDVSDVVKIATAAATDSAAGVLAVIDGNMEDPLIGDNPGYFLIAKDAGLEGVDISGHLCDLLFEKINT